MMPRELLSPRFTLTLPPVQDESLSTRSLPGGLPWRGGHGTGRSPRIPAMDRGTLLPPMERNPVISDGGPAYTQLHKGHLYKSQLGSSLPDLSSRLERQRKRLPRQYEKISFQVSTDTTPLRSSRIGYLPVLTPRTPVIVECRAQHPDSSLSAASVPSESNVVEIHADVLDQTFKQHAKPGTKTPWNKDCFCPRCGIMREQWVQRNRKPFRPFSRQREPTFMTLTVNQQHLHGGNSLPVPAEHLGKPQGGQLGLGGNNDENTQPVSKLQEESKENCGH